MGLLHVAFIAATFVISTSAFAQETNPTIEDETIRIETLKQAKTATEAFDNMTPDELAQALGLPTEAQFTEWLENAPENLLQKTADTPAAQPLVRVNVSIASQLLTLSAWNAVTNQYEVRLQTKVSTGRFSDGYGTKRGGCWKPYYLNKMHYSQAYDNSPMPWSVFYYGGWAIHGTDAIGRLGSEASHGCVRVHPAKAKEIFDYVKSVGKDNALICVPDERWAGNQRKPRAPKAQPAPPAAPRERSIARNDREREPTYQRPTPQRRSQQLQMPQAQKNFFWF